jgi:hypothetical protein
LPAENIDTKKVVRLAKNVELWKVGGKRPKTLAITGFYPFESYIEEWDRTVCKLCFLRLGFCLKRNKG